MVTSTNHRAHHSITQPGPGQLFWPARLVDELAVLKGSVPVGAFARLLAAVGGSQTGEVEYCLDFCRDKDQHAIVTGKVSTVLKLECQRCLERFNYPVQAPIRVEFVAEADAPARAVGFEAVYVEQSAPLVQFLETELLLALPFAPTHDWQTCHIDERYSKPSPGQYGAGEPGLSGSPFAVLREWVRPIDSPTE